MNKLKEYLVEILGGAGTLLGVAAMNMTPEQVTALLGLHGPGAIMAAMGVLTYIRGVYARRASASPVTPQAEPPSTVKSHYLVGVLVAVLALVGLCGCAAKPTPAQTIGLDALTAAAVAITVQRDTSDPATWAKRARLIVSVASQVRPLATDESVSVPALAAAVGPLLDQAKLAPGERIAANTLVASLATVIDANTAPDSPAAATVAAVLDSAVKAASVYLPMGSPPTTSTIF